MRSNQVRFDFHVCLPDLSSMHIPTLKQISCTADYRNIVKDFSNLSVIDILHDIDFDYLVAVCQEAE